MLGLPRNIGNIQVNSKPYNERVHSKVIKLLLFNCGFSQPCFLTEPSCVRH